MGLIILNRIFVGFGSVDVKRKNTLKSFQPRCYSAKNITVLNLWKIQIYEKYQDTPSEIQRHLPSLRLLGLCPQAHIMPTLSLLLRSLRMQNPCNFLSPEQITKTRVTTPVKILRDAKFYIIMYILY